MTDILPEFAPYWKLDRGEPPPFLLDRSTEDLGNDRVAKEVYLSSEWHEREKATLWKRTWQVACRENDIPTAGDQLAYDIGDQSVVIVRQADGALRAFHNACQHRGNRLVEGCSTAERIECSFHGWSWNLDGSLRAVTCPWDFPGLRAQDTGLAEVRLGSWNGWVFVNLDAAAEPLEQYLGPELRNQFERWPSTRAWKAAHVGKVIPCNWKLGLEAFIEAYHTVRTHPQILPYFADCDAQYDFYGPHARFVAASGVPSPHVEVSDEQMVVDSMIGDAFANLTGDHEGDREIPTLQPGQSARQVLADFVKATLEQQTGRNYRGVSDVEVLDVIEYFVFPNFVQFGGYGFPIAYRFTPHGDDPGSCLFEVMILVHLPEGAQVPRDVPLRMTPSDEPWSAAPETAGLGAITDQDTTNLKKLQRGLRSDGIRAVLFSNYQERNLRNFHRYLDRYVNGRRGSRR